MQQDVSLYIHRCFTNRELCSILTKALLWIMRSVFWSERRCFTCNYVHKWSTVLQNILINRGNNESSLFGNIWTWNFPPYITLIKLRLKYTVSACTYSFSSYDQCSYSPFLLAIFQIYEGFLGRSKHMTTLQAIGARFMLWGSEQSWAATLKPFWRTLRWEPLIEISAEPVRG